MICLHPPDSLGHIAVSTMNTTGGGGHRMEQARTDVTLQVNALKIKQRKALPLTISPHLPFLLIDSANCPSPINLRFLLFFSSTYDMDP